MRRDDIDLLDYWRIIRKRIWVIALFVIVCTVAAAYYSYKNYVPLYAAQTKLYVNNSDGADPFSRGVMNIGSLSTASGAIDTYKEIIRTPIIMDKVVERYPHLGLTTDQLIGAVGVYALNNTSVMVIAMTDYSYERAVMTVNAVTEVFTAEIPKISAANTAVILTEARMSSQPSPVNEKQNTYIVLAFIASLVVSIGLAILRDGMDDTMKTEDDVARVLGISTFASVPKTKLRPARSSRTSRKGYMGGIGDEAYAAGK